MSWTAVAGAASYDVWVSPVSGGGYVRANGAPVTGTSFTVTGLPNAKEAYVVVTATDAAGNAGAQSNEVHGQPHYAIGWSNLQWPPTMTHTISVVTRTDTAYGQVWIDGVTSQPGATPGLRAQLGFGPDGSNPDGNAAWTWVDGAFNVDAGNNDEYQASMLPESTGTFDYAWRYSTTGGRDWVYADLDGSPNGYSPAQAGSLTVNASGDSTAPATPSGLHVVSASPVGIELSWDAVAGDATLYGYELERSASASGPWELLVRLTDTRLHGHGGRRGRDLALPGPRPGPVVQPLGAVGSVSGTAELRTVTLVFNVTVPASTDGTGRPVHIAGFLDRLDGGHPQWDAGATPLTRVDATHWTITFTGLESTQLEYKYALGDFLYVEKDGACGEIANRQLTLSYGATGTQTVNDTVPNWRNVAPCGN